MKCWVSLVLLCGLIGCGSSSNEATSSAIGETPVGTKTYRIAVIPKGTSHEFWKSVHAGAENAAREFGNVEILWSGPQLENDRDGAKAA